MDVSWCRRAWRTAVSLIPMVLAALCLFVVMPPAPALAGAANFSPASYNFGHLKVGLTSSSKGFMLTNTRSRTVTINSGPAASGDFVVTSNGCPTGRSLDPGASCSVSVAFRPTAKGVRTGTLSASTTQGGLSSASLSGTGTIPIATVSPTSLDFGSLRPGTSSTRTATLSNTGSAVLVISSISVTGQFAMTRSCGSTLAAGSSCTISVTFKPTTAGSRSGSVNIKTDGGNRTVTLSGKGVGPVIKLAVSALNFGDQAVGSDSRPKVIKVTNTGGDRLFITRLSITGDFKQTNTCEPYINIGITCTISVTFSPRATKTRTGQVLIEGDVDPHTIKLTGVGIPAPAGSTPSGPPTGGSTSGPGPPAEQTSGAGLPGFVKYGAPIGVLLLIGALTMGGVSRRRAKVPAGGGPSPDGAESWETAAAAIGEELPEEPAGEFPEEPAGESAEEPSEREEAVFGWPSEGGD